MHKISSIILTILLFTSFAAFDIWNKSKYKVLGTINAAKIIVDINHNGRLDSDEIICIKDIDVLTSDIYTNQTELQKKLNISYVDAIKFGYLSDIFADNILADKEIKLKFEKSNSNQKSTDCRFADIITNSGSYKNLLSKSGYAIYNGKTSDKFYTILEKAKKQNLVILNHKSNKYHTLDCEYGHSANDAIILPKKQIPKDALPCKFCHVNKKHSKIDKSTKLYPSIISTGNIKLYLTDLTSKLKPDNTCSTTICKAIEDKINQAKSTIDIALYGYDKNKAIYNALKSAKSRNIRIRIIYDNSNNYYYPETKNILMLADKKSGDSTKTLMHNKFIIIDNNTVITGSMNFSNTGLSGFNTNAIAIINSEQIAKIYQEEFEQMINGRFSDKKSKINHKTVQINNSYVTPLFSPTDKAIKNNIVPIVNSAKSYIYMPAFLITHKELANALVNAKKRGVNVQIILDATGVYSTGSKYKALKSAGIPLKVENYAGKIHSKSIIIDDKYIIIGSMNFSNSGENKNDENVIIIKDSKLAGFYKRFFEYLWAKIPDKYLTSYPKAESKESIGSCSDGIDNDYDGKIDKDDEGCR